jgi:hypothetical protein
MDQEQFAQRVLSVVKADGSVTGLAVGGSWLTNELDEFSDLDLILVTREKCSGDKEKMLGYAGRFGELLAAFTGEHVGEPRLLICLYDHPFLHVDIKFLTIDELDGRIETPHILYDSDGLLQSRLTATPAKFPYPDYQWIEDRLWIWIHYVLLKIGRGEYFEALGFLAWLRGTVIGPLLHIRNGNLPRGVRRVETTIAAQDMAKLRSTLAGHEKRSLLEATENSIKLYAGLRAELFGKEVILREAARERVLRFLEQTKAGL